MQALSSHQVPVIDIAPFLAGDPIGRQQVVQAWASAFKEVGFATLVGHGIPAELIQQTYDQAMAFFELPLADKLAVALPDRVKNRGYIPINMESVAATRGNPAPPDLCEALVFYSLYQEDPQMPQAGLKAQTGNLWPSQPPHLKPTLLAYNAALMALLDTLMQISALALGLPENFFQPYIDQYQSVLRLVFYPEQADPPLPGQLRYGAHSDYGGFTILRQDNAPGGLQVCLKSGEWVDVLPMDNAFVINVGDLIARWTNDRWRSTLHRVVNPPPHSQGSARRLSLVCFTGPNPNAVIECLPTCQDATHPAKYGPVTAGDYIQSKIDVSML